MPNIHKYKRTFILTHNAYRYKCIHVYTHIHIYMHTYILHVSRYPTKTDKQAKTSQHHGIVLTW